MTDARQSLGRHAENLVARALRAGGATLLDRNARVPGVRGELDLIALDGRDLVFVEVKALRAGNRAGPERPVLAVGPRKQAKIRALAAGWLAARRGRLPRFGAIRFDVVGLRLDGRQVVHWEHLRGAF